MEQEKRSGEFRQKPELELLVYRGEVLYYCTGLVSMTLLSGILMSSGREALIVCKLVSYSSVVSSC